MRFGFVAQVYMAAGLVVDIETEAEERFENLGG
jgi:hypothetical protein